MGNSADPNYWYQKVPKGDGTFWGGEQDCMARWDTMLRLHEDLAGKRIIDVGAAEGFFSMECADRGAQVLSVEKERAMQTKFRLVRKGRGHVKTVTLVSKKAVDFFRKVADQTVDGVLSLNVIHHLHGPLQHLWDASRVLKPGGVLYLEVPKKSKPLIRFKRKESFYLSADMIQMVLDNWFSSHCVVLDWRNSVGNERVLYEAIK